MKLTKTESQLTENEEQLYREYGIIPEEADRFSKKQLSKMLDNNDIYIPQIHSATKKQIVQMLYENTYNGNMQDTLKIFRLGKRYYYYYTC